MFADVCSRLTEDDDPSMGSRENDVLFKNQLEVEEEVVKYLLEVVSLCVWALGRFWTWLFTLGKMW